jgi:polyisoprenoid-binding protein YceI
MRACDFLLALWPALILRGANVYTISPTEGANTALIVEKTGLLSGKKHLFVFNRYRGSLHFDRDRPEQSRVQLVIEANSIECKDTWISAKDLKKVQDTALNDMLAASENPEIRFVSTAIRMAGTDNYQVDGELTIRGRSKPAVVKLLLDSSEASKLAARGEARVRMTDYGLKPPSAALGTIGTKDEMTFTFTVIAKPE